MNFLTNLNIPLITGKGSLGESIINPSKWWDRFKNGETNDVNKDIADQNLQFQRENLDYEKALQKQIFEREDTAYQRTVNDMRLAGMNPLSMQGTNGAGEAIQTEPLNNGYSHTDTGNLQALSQIFNTVQQLSSMRNNSTITNAQANLINQQAENQRIKNVYESDILSNQIDSLRYSTIGQKYHNERENIAWLNDRRNYMFNEQFGLSDNMPDFAKIINYASHQGKLREDYYNEFNRTSEEFGRTHNNFLKNPSFSNIQSILEKSNLKGALSESMLGKVFLNMLGIGF